MKGVYKTLLRLYPADYSASFADEMLIAFEKECAEHRSRGWAAFVCFALSELAGLMVGILIEWIAKLRTDSSVRGRFLPDLRKMRPVGVPPELWFAAARVNLSQGSLPSEVEQVQRRITFLVDGVVHAIANRDFLAARSYSYEEYRERDNLRVIRKKYGLEP
jgi:hypothetical protein